LQLAFDRACAECEHGGDLCDSITFDAANSDAAEQIIAEQREQAAILFFEHDEEFWRRFVTDELIEGKDLASVGDTGEGSLGLDASGAAFLSGFAADMVDDLLPGDGQEHPPEVVAGFQIAKAAGGGAAANAAKDALGDVFFVGYATGRIAELAPGNIDQADGVVVPDFLSGVGLASFETGDPRANRALRMHLDAFPKRMGRLSSQSLSVTLAISWFHGTGRFLAIGGDLTKLGGLADRLTVPFWSSPLCPGPGRISQLARPQPIANGMEHGWRWCFWGDRRTVEGSLMNGTQVMVEIRAPQFAPPLGELVASELDTAWFTIDPSFRPIAMDPANTSLEMSLKAARETLLLVRGAVTEGWQNMLRALPRVLDVCADARVAPFDRRFGISKCDDWLVDVEEAAEFVDVAEEYDSNPTRACGCLLDIAAYTGADQIWQQGVLGDGVAIGVVDGGIWAEGRMDPNMPGLVPRVCDGWPQPNWGTQAHWRGHGNMCAIDALGMAPQASLYDIRITDSSQSHAFFSDAIAGIQWAIEKYRDTGTPQILTCGWGLYQELHDPRYATDANHPLTRKIIEALDEGMLVLFAAGNGGEACPATWCGNDTGPGKSIWGANGHPRVMTVGAANKDGQPVSYSSQGPAALDMHKPDFCGLSHFAGYFCSDSGTSAACAMAAGIVALLKQTRPTLTQETAKRLLKSTAKGLGLHGWDRHSGAGILQAKAAFDTLVGSAPAGRVDAARIEQLETENLLLRELFVDLALLKRSHRGNGARPH